MKELNIVVRTAGDPVGATFNLPSGATVTEPFPPSGEIVVMDLGLRLGLQHVVVSEDEGGAPEWTFDLNFQTGSYLHNGEAVALGAVLTEDAVNWGAFDPGHIVPATGLPGQEYPCFSGDLLTLALSGATILLDVTVPGASGSFIELAVTDLPSFDPFLVVRFDPDETLINDGQPSMASQAATWNAPGSYKLVCTMTPTKVSASVNGSAAITSGAIGPHATLDSLNLTIQSADVILTRLRAKAAVEDAELPTLSSIS